MERRVFIAVLLSFAVLYAYQALMRRFSPPPSPVTQARKTLPPAQRAEKQTQEKVEPPLISPGIPAPSALVADSEEQDIVVENDVIRVTFSNRGAQARSWILKRYNGVNGRPLDLVPDKLPADAPRPFSIKTDSEQINARIARALFKPSATRLDLMSTSGTLTFEYGDSSGLQVQKEFVFSPGSYLVQVNVSVVDSQGAVNPAIQWGPGIGEIAADKSQYVQEPQGVVCRDGSVVRVAGSMSAVFEEKLECAGVEDHYFLSAVLPGGQVAKVEFQPYALETGSTPKPLVAYRARIAGGPKATRYFVGPKDFDILASVNPGLVRVINFGWFAPLVVPLLRALKWINGYVGNYGWSIVILTILINAAMFPLRHKSVVSMRKMQELQPEVRAIQERYAKLKTTDPARQKMNVELMNLYRERGVNPASGCIPILLTMPVLFAFYSLLSVAIEIRGAPFMLWIRDLSRHDPYYVTPILMGGTMFWQQKMTPSTMDPMQQKVMMLMPVMFTFFFLRVPSGLVLYWLVSNIWAIAQQYVTNRIIGPPVVREVRPPAERRLKRVGAGKTNQAAKTEQATKTEQTMSHGPTA